MHLQIQLKPIYPTAAVCHLDLCKVNANTHSNCLAKSLEWSAVSAPCNILLFGDTFGRSPPLSAQSCVGTLLALGKQCANILELVDSATAFWQLSGTTRHLLVPWSSACAVTRHSGVPVTLANLKLQVSAMTEEVLRAVKPECYDVTMDAKEMLCVPPGVFRAELACNGVAEGVRFTLLPKSQAHRLRCSSYPPTRRLSSLHSFSLRQLFVKNGWLVGWSNLVRLTRVRRCWTHFATSPAQWGLAVARIRQQQQLRYLHW